MLPAVSGKETLAIYTTKLECILSELLVSDFPEKIIKEVVKLNIEKGIELPKTLQSLLEDSIEQHS